MSFKILVVEDEIVTADHLCDILNKLGYTALEPALNYTEAVQRMQEEMPDFAILDIHLGGQKSGLDVAQYIRENSQFPFVFLTANGDSQTIEKAKLCKPDGFLTKPFKNEDVQAAIEIAMDKHFDSKPVSEGQNVNYLADSLFVREKNLYVKIRFKDISWLEADGNYTIIHTTQKRYTVRNGLKQVEKNLPEDEFIRVHRSHVVRMDAISAINAVELHVGDFQVPISRNVQSMLLSKLNLLKSQDLE